MMKFTKERIREMVKVYGRPTIMSDDDFNALTIGMINEISEGAIPGGHYYRSRYALYFEQLVTHRPQETEAVKDNVAKSIHDALYLEIIVNLHQIKHEACRASRDEVIHMIDRLLQKVDS